MTIREFVKKLKEIKESGYIRTIRSGNTGVGHTLEQALGLHENNIATPDLGRVELKAQRKTATNRITLITKSPKWVVSAKETITKYGYRNGNGRMALKVTFSAKRMVSGLKLRFHPEDDNVELVNKKEEAIVYWKLSELSNIFNSKLPKLIIVKASSRVNGEREEFLYDEAYLLSGFNKKKFVELLEKEKIVIEFRMHIHNENNAVRDHGTGFRIAENYLDSLFKIRRDLV